MSHLPKYKFYLKKDPTTWYKSVSGVVSTTAIATPLSMSPIGWKETVIKWLRNQKYWGIGRFLTSTYQFVRDGAEILRKVKYTEGIEGQCTLEIWMLNDTDWTYSVLISCPVDFKSSTDKAIYFSANLLDNSIEAKVKANENTSYEIDCNSGSESNVLLDGITLYGTYIYAPQAATDDYHNTFQVPMLFINQDGDFPIAVPSDQAYSESFELSTLSSIGSTWADSMINSPCYANKFNQAVNVRFVVNQKIGLRRITSGFGATPARIRIIIVGADKIVTMNTVLYTSPVLSGSGGSYIEFSPNFTSSYYSVPAGGKVYYAIDLQFPTSPGYTRFEFFGNPDLSDPNPTYQIKMEVKFRIPPTLCPAIYYYSAFDRLMKKMFNTLSMVSYSTLLRTTVQMEDNVPATTMLTPGDAVRGFPKAKIRTTLNDMFQDANKRWMVGMGLDSSNLLVMERLNYFLDPTTIIYDLGDITEMEITNATELMFNKVKVGQDIQTYDNLNGRDEFNTTTKLKLPIDSLGNEQDWVTKYRADMTGLEEYRANLRQKKTTDSSSDNDTFVLSTQTIVVFGTPVTVLRRPDFTAGGSVTGVLDPSGVFNVDLSPARDTLRNKPYLASVTHLRGGQKITFQTSDKNQAFQSKFNSSRPNIIESSDYNVNDLGALLFLPLFFNFSAIVPRNLYQLMPLFSRGCFRFRYKGNQYKGFPWDVGLKPSTNDKYEFVLLSTPDNDIPKLYS